MSACGADMLTEQAVRGDGFSLIVVGLLTFLPVGEARGQKSATQRAAVGTM